MAETKNKLQKDTDNKKTFLEKSKTAFESEMALFERFFQSISHHAQTHKQITLNNIEAVDERLQALKAQVSQLQDSILYHDETVIVDRQEIIAETEAKVHTNNTLILDFDRSHADDIVDTLDYLNKALIQVKFDFFDTFRRNYLDVIGENQDYFAYIESKSSEFQEVLERHQEEIISTFLALNEEIAHMDDGITDIIKKKNETIQNIDTFFSREMKHYLDNQLMFSPVDDPTSIDIQALISDKIVQYNTFKKHLEAQNERMISHLKAKSQYLNQELTSRLLEQQSLQLIGKSSFFEDPDKNLRILKEELLTADNESDKQKVQRLARAVSVLKDHQAIREATEKKAAALAKSQRRFLNRMLEEYLIESTRTLNDLERTLSLYKNLMDYDTFLAQAIGDDSTKIVKVELDHLAVLAMNKELKLNIDFDINSINIKTKINEIEAKLVYQVKKQILLQQVELIDLVANIQTYIAERKALVFAAKNMVQRERILIDRLETAMNYHLEYLHEIASLNRKWNSEVLDQMIANIRGQETYNIHVAEAASRVKLGLKEYDMKALHFKTMYENELSYLVMQSSRVQEENAIHNEFLLTTLENQMRFAKEQIDLANSEFRLRAEAIIKAVDEERDYFNAVIENAEQKYQKKIKDLENHYQSVLYKILHLIEETADLKIHKLLEKDLDKLRNEYENQVISVLEQLEKDQKVIQTKRRLRDLDAHLDDALKDAEILRDDTIKEMKEQYTFAKDRYDALKPYLEQKVNILDPTFYNGFESINKRLKYKLKVAEVELDEATSHLLDEYVKTYFTEKPNFDESALRQKIDDLSLIRDNARTSYAEKMNRLEEAVQAEFEAYHDAINKHNDDKLSLISSINSKRDQTIAELQIELDATDRDNREKQDLLMVQHGQQVQNLTKEYESGRSSNHHFREEIASEFSKLMNSYKSYIKFAKKNPDIRDIFRFVTKDANRKLRRNLKSIRQRSKKDPYV
ncbi:MAG: hypothetical protein PHI01_04445 [Candidatus Izemoplasmatales bacterium]|nr:hypothetical protein [Candidatus Izemoplasmatales bacterium]